MKVSELYIKETCNCSAGITSYESPTKIKTLIIKNKIKKKPKIKEKSNETI